MDALASGERQLADQGLADLLVDEHVVGGMIDGQLLDQVPALGGLDRVEELVLRRVGHRREMRERERPPDHRCACQHPAMRRIELVEAPGDEQLDALRHLGRTDLEPRAPLALVVEELAGVTEVPEQLLDEERVALRLLDHEVDELLRCGEAGPAREHLAHLIDGQ